ncbi:Nuclear cap-binding protein subunit 2 [Phytophthora cactorum]|nr:Nuclear cap-binding protein subunit 2 [Phytophthora cactorum]
MPRLNSVFLVCIVAWTTIVAITDAAECTAAQISELSTLNSNVTAVCGSDALSGTMSTTAYCNNSSCLAFLTSMASSVPSCEVESYNLRTVLTTAIRSCNAASDAVPALRSSSQSLHHHNNGRRQTYCSWTTSYRRSRHSERHSLNPITLVSLFTLSKLIFICVTRVGHVKRVIMGLDRFKKTPCGFCFVEYSTHAEAEACSQFLSETKLDNRVVRCEMDGGFREGRQFGRGLSGGQVRDDRRSKDDYDAGRGGYGRGDDATADGHHFRRSAHVKRPRDDGIAADEPPASRQRRPDSPGDENKEEENPRFRHRENDADREDEPVNSRQWSSLCRRHTRPLSVEERR